MIFMKVRSQGESRLRLFLFTRFEAGALERCFRVGPGNRIGSVFTADGKLLKAMGET